MNLILSALKKEPALVAFVFQGEFPIPRVGRIVLGHEFSGEIVSLGEDVAESSRLNIGDRVAVDPNL